MRVFGRRRESAPGESSCLVDLRGLDRVPWAQLAHAYGPAADVPGAIRDLVSGDAGARNAATASLFGTIWHRGTVYEATAPAVPFLVSVAAATGLPDRGQVIELLGAIGGGHGYVEVHRWLLERGGFPGEELDVSEQAERRWVTDARAAVLAAAPGLARLLDDEDVNVRRAVPHTLAGLHEEGPVICRAILARVRVEDDPPAAASQLLALAALAMRTGERQHVSDALTLTMNSHGVVGLARAVAVAALADSDKGCRAAVDAFASASPEGYAEFTALPWAAGGGPVALMAGAVGERPPLHVMLLEKLVNNPAREAQAAAVSQVGETIRRWRSVTPQCVTMLSQVAAGSNLALRRGAVSELAYAFPACAAAAEALAANIDDPQARGQAVVTLARLHDERALPVVAAAVRETNPPPWVGEALKGLDVTAAHLLHDVVAMLARLPAPQRGNRAPDNRLAQCLNWIGNLGEAATPAVPHVRDLLESGRAPRAAAAALARLGPVASAAAASLRVLLTASTDPVLRYHAAFGIWGATGDVRPLVTLGRELIDVRRSSILLGYLEQVGSAAADLAPLLARHMGDGWEWDRVRTARAHWKLTRDTEQVLPELLQLADATPAGMAAIEALGWIGSPAHPVAPRLEEWLAQDRRLAGIGAINDIVERHETFRATAAATLAAVAS
jgi:hypothetical protein